MGLDAYGASDKAIRNATEIIELVFQLHAETERLKEANAALLAVVEPYAAMFAGCSCGFGPLGGSKCLPCKARNAIGLAKGGPP